MSDNVCLHVARTSYVSTNDVLALAAAEYASVTANRFLHSSDTSLRWHGATQRCYMQLTLEVSKASCTV
jgi:hypothetical protein